MAPTRVILMSCGSYNPPTNMHLRMFEIARDHLHKMGTHIVVGAVISPTHDDYAKKELTTSEHRCAMLKLATQNSDWIRVSTWETRQNGWTKTRLSLQHHQNMLNSVLLDSNDIKYHGETEDTAWIPENIKNSSDRTPIQIKLLCGADLLESFGTLGLWADEDIDAIVGQHGLVVVTREGSNPNKFIYDSDILSKYMHNIHIVTEWIPNEVSSTKIRRALKRGESVRYLLHDSVIEYIYEHGIYEAKTVSTIKLELSSKNDNDYLSIQPKYESTFLTPSPSDVTMTTPSPIEIISIDLSETVIKKNYHNTPITSRTNYSEMTNDYDDTREKFNNVMSENVNKILGSNKIVYPGQAKQIIANESGESQIFCEVGLNRASENCKFEMEIDGKVDLVAIKNDNLPDRTFDVGERESEEEIVTFKDVPPMIDSARALKSEELASSAPDESESQNTVTIPTDVTDTCNVGKVQKPSEAELPSTSIDSEEENPRAPNKIDADEMTMANVDEKSPTSDTERDYISQGDKGGRSKNVQDASIPKAIELTESPDLSNSEIVVSIIEEKLDSLDEISDSKEKSNVAMYDRDLSDQDATTTEESAPKRDGSMEIDGKYLKSVVNSRKSPKKVKNDEVSSVSSEARGSSEINVVEKSNGEIDVAPSSTVVEAIEDADLTRKTVRTGGRKRGVVFQGSLDSINVKRTESTSTLNGDGHPRITKKSKSYEFIKPTDVQPTTIYKIPLKDEDPSSRRDDSSKMKADGESTFEAANGARESGQTDEFCSVCCYANEPSTTEAFYTLGSAGSSPLEEASTECDICSNCDLREDPEQQRETPAKFMKPVGPGEPVCELCEICGDVAMDEDVVASSRPEKDDFVDRRLSASRPLPLSLPKKKKKSVVRLSGRNFGSIDNDDEEEDDEDDMDHFEIETSGVCRKIIENREKKPMFTAKSIEQNSTDDTNSNDDEFEIENCGLDTDHERDVANDEDSRYKNEVEDTLRNIVPRDEIAMSTKNSKKKMARAGSLINRDTIDRTRAKRRYSSVDNLPNTRQTVKVTVDKPNSLRSRGMVKGLVASADNIRPVRNSRSRTTLRKSADDVTRDHHSSMDDTRETPLYENTRRSTLTAKGEQPNKPRDTGTIKMILTKHGIKIISDKETAL